MIEVGDRVGALQRANSTTAYMYGYGTYKGEVDSPIGVPNPCIELDSGDVVWGFQCWWGAEEIVKASIGSREVVMVDVPKNNQEAS